MTEDLHTYAGLYALDALDGDMLPEFERHLVACAPCQQEVEEFRATASGLVEPVTPPPALRSSILAAITDVRQEAPTVVALRSKRPRWFAPFAIAAAAVAAVAVLQTVDRSAPLTASAIVRASDARVVELEGPPGVQVRAYISKDRVAVTAEGMENAPAGKSFELWLIGPAGPDAAGLMPASSGKPVEVLLKGKASGHQVVAITLEPEGGLPKPSGDVLAKGQI